MSSILPASPTRGEWPKLFKVELEKVCTTNECTTQEAASHLLIRRKSCLTRKMTELLNDHPMHISSLYDLYVKKVSTKDPDDKIICAKCIEKISKNKTCHFLFSECALLEQLASGALQQLPF